MDVHIRKGEDIGAAQFPLISEALEYFDVMMDVDDFGVTYFDGHIDHENDYAVMETDDFRQLDERSRQHLRQHIEQEGLDGSQSPDDLAAFISRLSLNQLERVVADIAGLHTRGLTAQEKAEIDETLQRVEDDYCDGACEALDDLLANDNVGRVLDSESPFLELPAPDAEMLERIRHVQMPAWFILDVSYSMAFEARIDHANAFVRRLSDHLRDERLSDAVSCLIYWGETRQIDLNDRRRFNVGESTNTGEALRIVGDEIRQLPDQAPVFVALVTDGVPNCAGAVDGKDLGPVDYTVHMAAQLPENVIFTQFAFAPVDPGDPDRPETLEDFQAYLTDLKRVSDAVQHGQTCVLVKESEHQLPWLPLGAFRKAKHLALVDERFALLEDL